MEEFSKAASDNAMSPELSKNHDIIIARLTELAIKEEHDEPSEIVDGSMLTILAYAVMLKAKPDDLPLLTKFTAWLELLGFEPEDDAPEGLVPRVYQHCEALFRDMIQKHPDSILLHYGLAAALKSQKKWDECANVAKKGVTLPDIKEAGYGEEPKSWRSALYEDILLDEKLPKSLRLTKPAPSH